MAETRFVNYQSCCRLCLCDKVDSLKSVFDDATTADRSLPQKILAFVAVEIASTDKMSTMVCDQCINKVNDWQSYKEECSENQNKLEQWMQMWTSGDAADLSIQIKEEPVGDDDVEIVEVTDGEPIKPEPMEEDYDYPPPLTPHPPDLLHVDDDDSQNSITSESGNPRKCSICDKLFSTPGNRKKHERHMHGKPSSVGTASADEHSQNSMDSQEELAETVVAEPPTDEQQKIQFAAGLKLLQTNETPIAFEPLSKIEISYIEKCKAMATMHKTHVCACHNVPHPNLKGLLSHLRSLRIWFPVFTCYNCMITFTDRSSFTKHNVRCHRPSVEALIKLSHLRKRSEVKTRLYQNYKCTSCRFMFSFHDEFCKHVDEEHVTGSGPFKCSCTRTFKKVEEYKDHIYVSCLVEFYCDICFITIKTLSAFQEHASQVHDNSEGFVLLQDDNYRMRKSVTKVAPAVPENVILHTKRRSSFYNKAPILEPELEDVKPAPMKVFNPAVSHSKKKPTKCPSCSKIYSNYANMMRHYKTHTPDEVKGRNGESNNSDSYYSCPDCGGMYNTKNWQKHLTEKHESKNCSECGKAFQFQTELDQHRSVHLNLKVYRDSKTKSYKSTMLSPSADGSVVLVCEECDAIFATNEELLQHKLTHENMPMLAVSTKVEPRGFECTICDLQFSGYKSLWDHDRQNHPKKRTPQSKDYPKQCKFCDKLLYTGGSYYMHKQMHERSNNTVKVEVSSTKSKRTSVSADEDDEEESYHTCKRCFKVFASKYSLKNHMKSHGIHLPPTTKSKGPKKVWCESCHVPCENQEALERHRQEEHSMDDMPTLTSQVNSDTKGLIFTCDICVMTFNTKIALKKHKEKHAQEGGRQAINKHTSIYCKYCKIGFESVALLNRHMLVEHAQSKMKTVKKDRNAGFTCNICKKIFQNATALYAHSGWHKRGHISAAGKLGKVLKQTKAEPESPPAEYQCTTCFAELPNDTALQIHILEKHRNVNAIMLIPRCNTCNLDFKTQDEYDTHKRYHDFLERQQGGKQKLQNPQKQQGAVSRVKGFPCNYCSAGFSRADTLSAHIRLAHKDLVEPEYHCTQCDRVFDKQTSLNIHLKVHEKQRASAKPLFSCSICNMGFDLPKDLRTHTINAHPF